VPSACTENRASCAHPYSFMHILPLNAPLSSPVPPPPLHTQSLCPCCPCCCPCCRTR
jgi:hypothetical protein